MERKIGEVEKQKEYHESYQQARKMVVEGNYTKPAASLKRFPLTP